jgi:hypothetical protein
VSAPSVSSADRKTPSINESHDRHSHPDCHTPLAVDFFQVQKEVAALLKDRIVVGHALQNDMQVNPFSTIPHVS